jgi:hypothetical protein
MSYENSLWVGSAYRDPENYLSGALLIGHSTYGTHSDDPHGIEAWINGGRDQTFSTLYGHVTGLSAADARRDDRRKFFDNFAFTNFVSRVLGEEDRDPTEAEYRQAAVELAEVIERANPISIFVFGIKHQSYSLPVIDASRIPYKATVHVIMDREGRFSPAWHEFVEMLPRLREEQRLMEGQRLQLAEPTAKGSEAMPDEEDHADSYPKNDLIRQFEEEDLISHSERKGDIWWLLQYELMTRAITLEVAARSIREAVGNMHEQTPEEQLSRVKTALERQRVDQSLQELKAHFQKMAELLPLIRQLESKWSWGVPGE